MKWLFHLFYLSRLKIRQTNMSQRISHASQFFGVMLCRLQTYRGACWDSTSLWRPQWLSAGLISPYALDHFHSLNFETLVHMVAVSTSVQIEGEGLFGIQLKWKLRRKGENSRGLCWRYSLANNTTSNTQDSTVLNCHNWQVLWVKCPLQQQHPF